MWKLKGQNAFLYLFKYGHDVFLNYGSWYHRMNLCGVLKQHHETHVVTQLLWMLTLFLEINLQFHISLMVNYNICFERVDFWESFNFQVMASAPDDSSLLSDQDTNQFLV